MLITPEYVERKFNEFNHTIFGGRLVELPFRISPARSFLGCIRYKHRRKFLGGIHYYDFEFVISSHNNKIESEQVVEDIIIHEMIHYYILSNQMQDTSAHGKIFRQMMANINKQFGRHITISHKTTAREQEADTEKRQHLICITHFPDGRTGLTIVARTQLFNLWSTLPNLLGATSHRWFISNDPFFNRFRKSIKPKAYLIDEEEIMPHLADAKPLIREGNVIKIGRRPHNKQ